MTRPRLQHVPVDELPSRVARPGDRWRIQRAPSRKAHDRHVWLAGPTDLHVLATTRAKYLEFTTWRRALSYALQRYDGIPITTDAFERSLHAALGLPRVR